MKYLYKIFTVKSSSVLPSLLGTGAELQKEKNFILRYQKNLHHKMKMEFFIAPT